MASLPSELDLEMRRKLQAGFDRLACSALELTWEADKLLELLKVQSEEEDG